jgi:hypothetical protein
MRNAYDYCWGQGKAENLARNQKHQKNTQPRSSCFSTHPWRRRRGHHIEESQISSIYFCFWRCWPSCPASLVPWFTCPRALSNLHGLWPVWCPDNLTRLPYVWGLWARFASAARGAARKSTSPKQDATWHSMKELVSWRVLFLWSRIKMWIS